MVECRTVDTDWILIVILNLFDGARLRLSHFDRITGFPIHLTLDLNKLAESVIQKYGVSIHEWAALVMTRGTDFLEKCIDGLPDWNPNPGRLAKNQARGQHADEPASEAAAARRGAKNQRVRRSARAAGARACGAAGGAGAGGAARKPRGGELAHSSRRRPSRMAELEHSTRSGTLTPATCAASPVGRA